jgi:hypothetical protein
MKKLAILFLLCMSFAVSSNAQTHARPRPKAMPAIVPVKPGVDKGSISGRTYTNDTFRFEVTFPDAWLLPGDDFEDFMRSKGIDLSLKAPDSLPPASRAKINSALQRVTILATAYRSMPGTTGNAIVRISAEDLSANPQIKDAVDYFDAMRASFAAMRLPADFKYSDTQAEKLGEHQFGFLDVTTKDGKKRMYATVRNGYAIMFTLTYSSNDDLATFRSVLADGNFALK